MAASSRYGTPDNPTPLQVDKARVRAVFPDANLRYSDRVGYVVEMSRNGLTVTLGSGHSVQAAWSKALDMVTMIAAAKLRDKKPTVTRKRRKASK